MKLFRIISSIVLAFLVLVSSTSFLVGIHYCGKEVQNIAVFTKADGCEKEQKLPPCHKHESPPCCDDETVIHNAEDVKAAAVDIHLDTSIPTEIEQRLVLISEIIPAVRTTHIKYYNYDPPLRSCDRLVEHQVFLI